MKNKKKTSCWELLHDCRRGAALLMVLLVSVFVITLGSSVLFTSYNGYMINLVNRESQSTFYTTEENLENVLGKVQELASNALKTAYTQVMSEYYFLFANSSDDEIQEKAQVLFNQYFMEELAKYKADGTTTGSGDSIFDITVTPDSSAVGGLNVSGSFNSSVLTELVFGAGSTDVFVTSVVGNIGSLLFETNSDGSQRLVMGSVTVSYVNDAGSANSYLTNITTDIIIEMPDFVQDGKVNTGRDPVVGQDGLPFENAATIGRLWVKSSTSLSSGLLVEGDIYGGVFFTYVEDDSNVDPEDIVFSHGGGRLITHTSPIVSNASDDIFLTGTTFKHELEGIEMKEGTVFYCEESSEIWTCSITAEEGSDVYLAGVPGYHGDYTVDVEYGGVNVQGDLVMAGGSDTSRSILSIDGNYFGFGNGNTGASSSAILINNSGVDWYMGGMNGDGSTLNLTLAGTNYLNMGRYNDSGIQLNTGSEFMTGQSWGTIIDQIAYMIPTAALLGGYNTNPMMVESSNSLKNLTVDTTYVLWEDKTIADYAGSQARVIYSSFGTAGTVAYLMFDFSKGPASTDPASTELDNASAYFKDYVTYNNDVFKNNLSLFVTMDQLAEANFQAVGEVYYTNSSSGVQISSKAGSMSADEIRAAADVKQAQFNLASLTLWPDWSGRLYTGPFKIFTRGIDGNNLTETYQVVAAVDNPFDFYVKQWALMMDVEYTGYSRLQGGTQGSDEWRHEMHFRDWIPDFDVVVDVQDASGDWTTFDTGVNLSRLGFADIIAFMEIYYEDNAYLNEFVYSATDFTAADRTLETPSYPFTSNEFITGNYNYFRVKIPDDKVDESVAAFLQSKMLGVFGHSGFDYFDNKASKYLPTSSSSINNSADDICLILASSGINVYDSYVGLAMSAVGIAILEEIETDPYKLNDAVETAWTILRDGDDYYAVPLFGYFRNMEWVSSTEFENSTESVPGSTDSYVNWGSGDLVYFDNWEKH